MRSVKTSTKSFILFGVLNFAGFVSTSLIHDPIRGMICLAGGAFFLGVGWVCESIERGRSE